MIGKKIQHYEVLRELGQGGMGTVYEAEDSRLGRRVAIKVLPGEAVRDLALVERFKREAKTASALNHPNIVTIHDIVVSAEFQCIVMERVEGHTLREWMRGDPSLDDSIAVASQVARALAAAHDAGIVHRDIKPDNIMVRADGIVKMLDFGLAKLIDQSRLTREGAVIGTVAYMSPEQAKGGHVSDRTDVWSLGVVMYEMLTGQPPFHADYDQAVLYNILNTPAKPISEGNPAVSAPLGSLVMRMLEKDPGRRPGAREVAEALTGAVTAPAQRVNDRVAGAWEMHEDRRPVAVLPFKILSGGSDYDFLSLALAEAVSHGLSANRDLLVRPTSAVVRYAERDVDPMVVGRDLNVAVVVEGSIQKLGEHVRVQVQAWDTARGSTLRSVKLDGQLSDLFGLQDRLAEKLSESMGLGQEGPSAERPTQSAQAYELYLRASERLLRYDMDGMSRAIDMLRKSVALDPQFADAWSRLSIALVNMGTFFDPQWKWYEEAETAVQRALSLDASNAEAWTARGRILWTPQHGFQHAQALRDLGKACCQVAPAPDAHLWRGLVLSHIGLLDEGLADFRRASESQPDDLLATLSMGETLGWSGDLHGNLEYVSEVLARDPAFQFGRLFHPIPLLYLDRLEEAESALATAKKILGHDSMILAAESLLWAKRGEIERTRQTLQATFEKKQSTSHMHHTYHYAAAACATIGEGARAVELLQQSADAGMPNYPAFVNDLHFAPLHDRPDFKELMSSLESGWESFRAEFGKGAGSGSSPDPTPDR